MTFFDMKPASNQAVSKSLWIYFIDTALITIVVVTAWVVLIKKYRQANSNIITMNSRVVRRVMIRRCLDLEKKMRDVYRRC